MKKIFFGTLNRTLISIVIMAVLPALGIILHSGFTSSREAGRAAQRSMAELTHSIARHQQLTLENTQVLFTALSKLREVRSLSQDVASGLLQSITNANQQYSRVYIVGKNGVIVSSSSFLAPPLSAEERRFLARAMEKDEFAVSSFSVDRSTLEGRFCVALPILSLDGKTEAALFAYLRLDPRRGDFLTGMTREGSKVQVADSEGRLVYCYPPQPEQIPGMFLPENLIRRIRGASDGRVHTIRHPHSRELVMFQTMALDGDKEPVSSIILSIPTEKVYAAADAMMRRNLTLLGAATALALAIAAFLARWSFVRPISDVTTVAERLTLGDLSARAAFAGTGGEIELFAATFNSMADNLEKSRERLIETRQLADAANKAKSEFLANMSHEIRTPMNAIIGMAYLALKTELDERQKGYLSKVHTAANSLLEIINSILDFSKMEAGKLQLESLPFDLDTVFANAASSIQQIAAEKGRTCHCVLDPDVPHRLQGDPLRLGQVLINLASSALRLAGEGSVTLRCSLEHATPEHARLCFTMQDLSAGLPPAQKADLFHQEGEPGRSGTTLGFAIVGRLVTLMHGSVEVRDSAQHGSSIAISLPFTRARSTEETPRPLERMRGKRVLVVDDHPGSRSALRSMLERFTLSVDEAGDAFSALALLRREKEQGRSFDLVLMDWHLPGMDGVQATVGIKQDLGLSPAPPVVLITDFGRSDILQRAEGAGVDSFLHKPIDSSLLYNAIQGLLRDVARYDSPAPSAPEAPVRLDGVRLLLAEDNAINQQIASEILSGVGAVVDIAANGQEAVEAVLRSVKSGSAPYDAVLMDLQMPVMDGYTATREIRRHSLFHALPIIAMTAHALAEEGQHCAEAGMNDYATKPIEVQALLHTLRRWIPRLSGQGKTAARLRNLS